MKAVFVCPECGFPLDPVHMFAVATTSLKSIRLVWGNRPGIVRLIEARAESDILYLHSWCFFGPEDCA